MFLISNIEQGQITCFRCSRGVWCGENKEVNSVEDRSLDINQDLTGLFSIARRQQRYQPPCFS